MPRTRLLVIAANRLYREGLQRELESVPSLEVIGALAHPSVAEALRLDPDVILTDGCGPDDVLLISALGRPADVKVIALGLTGDDDEVLELVKAGIAGYVTQEASLDEMVQTVLQVARGEMPCSSKVAARMASHIRTHEALRAGERPLAGLTSRELEIVALLDEGLSNKEIALRLKIDHRTVKNHARSIYGKLAVHSRAEAAASMRRAMRRAAAPSPLRPAD